MDGTWTLDRLRMWLWPRVIHGETCPLCHQYAKAYDRKVTAPMVTVLRRMVRQHALVGEEWVNMPALRSRGQDESIMRFFGLIEPMPNGVRPDGSKRVGLWKVTPAGGLFLAGRHRIPKYIRIYNNQSLGQVGTEMVDVVDVTGQTFSFDDLMAGR